MSTTLLNFFRETFAPLFLRGRSERTRQLYLTTLRNFEKHLGRPPALGEFTDDSVSRYLSWFRGLPRSPASTNKERNNLLAMWRFAARKRYVDRWPDVRAETEPERIPRAWTADELKRLLHSCSGESGLVSGVVAPEWWTALHLVAWDSGERISALLGLKWSDVDLTDGWLHVPAEIRKGKRKDRVFRLSPDTIAALRRITKPKRPLVFPWVLDRSYIWKRYEPILDRAGLPTDRLSKFHRMRRSVASHFEAAGGNATELLGHSRRQVTVTYLDPRIVGEKQAADLLFRISPIDKSDPPGKDAG